MTTTRALIAGVMLAGVLAVAGPAPQAGAHVEQSHCKTLDWGYNSNGMQFQNQVKHGSHVDCVYRGQLRCAIYFWGSVHYQTVFSQYYLKKTTGYSNVRTLLCPTHWVRDDFGWSSSDSAYPNGGGDWAAEPGV